HFLGQLRYACGSSDHPDPKMFIEVYRLLTFYSLVKPPRGSNVKGGDVLSSLLELKDVVGEKNEERRRDLEGKIDEIIDGAILLDMGEGGMMKKLCPHNLCENQLADMAMQLPEQSDSSHVDEGKGKK
ncbi:UPF0223 protein, partial [Frankliniella fusca]